MDQQQQPKQIQIKAQDEELKGKYSNLMQITHTQEEFVLDFFLVGNSAAGHAYFPRDYEPRTRKAHDPRSAG